MDDQQSASRPAGDMDLDFLAAQLKLFLDNADAVAQDDGRWL